MHQNAHRIKTLIFLTVFALTWIVFFKPLKCNGFCKSPSFVYENQFKLSDVGKIAGIAANRYIPIFSGGKYVQIADIYDNIIVAEIVLSDLPVDGVIDPEDDTIGWFLLKSGSLVKFDMSSPEVSLWKVSQSYEFSGLASAIDAGGKETPVVAVGMVLQDSMEISVFDKNNLSEVKNKITIDETRTISDILLTDQGLYVLLEATGKVLLFDIESGNLKAEGNAGNMPVSFVFDKKRKQILVANPGPGTISVLDSENLTLKKTIDDPNLMTDPVIMAIADNIAYIGCGGIKAGIISLDLDDLVLIGKGVSLSRAPNDIVYLDDRQMIYFTDNSGLYYSFDDTCIRVQTRVRQGAWKSSIEVLVSPDEMFGVRVEGGTPPFDLPSTGSVTCNLDESDDSGRSFICEASHEENYPLYLTDGSGNSKVLMARVAEPIAISPSGALETYVAGDPLVFSVSGGFSPITWQTSYGILSSNYGRTVVYFPPDIAYEDMIKVQDRTGSVLYTSVNVSLPGIALTPAQRVLLPNETSSFNLIASESGSYNWRATGGEINVNENNKNQAEYKAPKETGDYEIIVSNTVNEKETAIAKVFVVSDQLTITPEKAVLGRDESMTFVVSGGKGPYTWSAQRGNLDTFKGNSVIYTSSQISGETRLSVVDTGGRVVSAQISIEGDFRLSPVISVARPDEEVRFSLVGASGEAGWQAEEGSFVKKDDDGALYKSPSHSGTYDILAMDQRGYTAWSRVYVVNESLFLKASTDQVKEKETLLISVEGGVPPYSWTAQQGFLSSTSGRIITWIAPELNPDLQQDSSDLEQDNKVLLTVTDSMDSVAVKEFYVTSAEKEGECAYLLDNLKLSFPCIQIGNDRFEFFMNYLSGLTWEVDIDSLKSSSIGGSCLVLKDDLSFHVPCFEYAGVEYSFSLIYNNGLSWNLVFD